MNKSIKRPIGAHLSTAGGLNKSVDRAVEIGANAVQIFAGSPRSWRRKDIDKKSLQEFQEYGISKGVRDIFVHALYLTNLASNKKEIVQKSKKALMHDIKLSSYFGCKGVVVHVGSHQGRGWEASKQDVAVLIKNVIDEAAVEVPFLIENSAGQKGKLNSELSEIRWLLDEIDRPQLGWCYDTCHGWAAGYRANSPGQLAEGEKDLWSEVEKYDLWDSLQCLHVNDSRDPAASGRDRHDNILAGQMNPDDLKAVITQPRWQKVPIITEAPGFEGQGPDKENIDRLKKINEG